MRISWNIIERAEWPPTLASEKPNAAAFIDALETLCQSLIPIRLPFSPTALSGGGK
jgi:hypothetical protein